MTSIQAVNAPAFTSRAKAQENQYSGTKAGAAYALISAGTAYGIKKAVDPMTKWESKLIRKQIAQIRQNPEIYTNAKELIDNAYKNMSNAFKSRKIIKNTNALKKSFAVFAPLAIGCGLIVDILNNRQRKTSQPDTYTEKGNMYKKVDMGKKSGAILGAVSYLIMNAVNGKALNGMGATPVSKAITVGIGALGGYILGSIADNKANAKAVKRADA